MARYDIGGVMLIPDRFTIDPIDGEERPAAGANPINLFTNAAETPLDVAKSASAWIMRYGQDYHTENLFWGAAKILNSCSPRLREKIEESCREFPVQHCTAPVYFVLLYKVVLSSTPLSMQTVIR